MKKPEMQIAGRKIGYHHNPIVLAEIGINHEGILQTAIEMVEAAISAGAEMIKHQTHVVADEMSDAAKNTIPGNSPDSIYDIMDRCSLNEEEEWELKRYTESRGAIFISTPFSRAAVDRLVKFEVPAFKIGSGECNNYPLLDYICSFRKPIILSTGMNNLVSVRKAVKIIRKYKIPFALLHTTNLYPTPPELVRLGSLVDLEKAFPDAVIGLSDHTTNNLACLGAVALGASILERHFTDSKDRKGPDIVCSMTPGELNELIASSKVLKLERGGSKKSLLREEEVTRNFAFATVVTIKPVNEGEIFSKENLWVKRPGTGRISAAEFHNVIGKRAARDIMMNVHLDWSDIR